MNTEERYNLSLYHSGVINASREDVWKSIDNFFDLSWTGNPLILEIKEKGPIRQVHVTDTKFLAEELLERNHGVNESFHKYSIHTPEDMETFAFPFKLYDYQGSVRVSDITVGDKKCCTITWSSSGSTDCIEGKQFYEQALGGLFSGGITNLQRTFNKKDDQSEECTDL